MGQQLLASLKELDCPAVAPVLAYMYVFVFTQSKVVISVFMKTHIYLYKHI
jgi:hypothetical protein